MKTIAGAQYSSGDVFYSSCHNTWLLISLTTFTNQIYIQYSMGGHIVGPWSIPQLLWDSVPAIGSFGNYAAHAYPQWLGTDSDELIISWTYNTNATRMALVTFF